MDAGAQEISHRLPHYLPDGSGVTFTVLRYAYAAPDWKRAQVWVRSFKTGERKLLLENALDGRVVGNYLVFARQGRLLAVHFDAKTLSVAGAQVPVLDGVMHAANGVGVTTTSGAAQFSVAANGTLLYAPGSIEPPLQGSLMWVDRSGRVTPFPSKPMPYGSVRISRNGARVLMTDYDVERTLWLFDISRGTQERQTLDGLSIDGIWSPDGSRIVFRSNRSGPTRLYVQTLNSTDAMPITPGPLDYPGAWTPDGKEIVFAHADPSKRTPTYDIYVVSLDQPDKTRAILNSPASETYPDLSPDGHWLAYCSNKSGRSELYVQPYPGPGAPVRVSTDGANEPAWSRDGKELFYRMPSGKMMSVKFRISGSEFVPEKPVTLFEGSYPATTPTRRYDVSPDGRFLLEQYINDVGERDKKIFPSTLRVVLNWTDELQRVLPSSR